jgi:hypothetical protein
MTSVWTLSRSKSVFLQPIKSNEAFFTYFHFNRQVGTRLAAIFSLNCLQGQASFQRIDLTLLNSLQPFMARDILRMVLSKSKTSVVSIPLYEEQIGEDVLDQFQFAHASEQMDEAMRGLHSKGLEEMREVGYSSLYVGFPMLSYFDPLDRSLRVFLLRSCFGRSLAPDKSYDDGDQKTGGRDSAKYNTQTLVDATENEIAS